MAPQPVIPTIICPKCGQTLPVRAQICQFCQTDVRNVPRGHTQDYKPSNPDDAMSWQKVMYYVMGVWWVLSGLFTVLASAKFMNAMLASSTASLFAGIPAIGVVFGVIQVLVGVGLLLRIEIARGIVNILSWLTIVGGVMTIGSHLLAGIIMGPKVFVGIFRALIDCGVAGLQIYLIGETDKFM